MDDPVSNKKKNFLIRKGAKREFGSVLFQGVPEDLLIDYLSFNYVYVPNLLRT